MYIHISFSVECQLTSNVHTGHLSMDWMGSINLLFSRLTLLIARKSQKQIQLKCTEQRWLVLEDKFIIKCVFSFLFLFFLSVPEPQVTLDVDFNSSGASRVCITVVKEAEAQEMGKVTILPEQLLENCNAIVSSPWSSTSFLYRNIAKGYFNHKQYMHICPKQSAVVTRLDTLGSYWGSLLQTTISEFKQCQAKGYVV